MCLVHRFSSVYSSDIVFFEHSSILHVLVSTHHPRVPGFVKLAPIKSQRKEDVEVGSRKEERVEQVQEVRDSSSSTHISRFHYYLYLLIYLSIVIMTFSCAHV